MGLLRAQGACPIRMKSRHLNDDHFIDLVMGNKDMGGFAFFLGNGRLR
jgi:hypothetical protein